MKLPACEFTDYADGSECEREGFARLNGVPGCPAICREHYEYLKESDDKENTGLLKNAKLLDPASPGKIRSNGVDGKVRWFQPEK